jgi:hypothetical protein
MQKSPTRKMMQTIDVTGIIMPHDWGQDGRVVQIAVYTNKEEVYLVEHNRMGQELLKYINRRVEIRGEKREKLDGKNYIGVKKFQVLEEIVDEEHDLTI